MDVAAWVDEKFPDHIKIYADVLEAWSYAKDMAMEMEPGVATHFLKMFNPNVALWHRFITTYDRDFRPDPTLYITYIKSLHHKRFAHAYILSDKLIASYKSWLASQAVYYNTVERIPLFREIFRRKV